MNKEELLKPRYKLISDFPGNWNKVGDVLEADTLYMDGETFTMGDYPAIFDRLEWWEERKKEELPQYVLLGDIVWNISEWSTNWVVPHADPDDSDGKYFSVLWHFRKKEAIPATEQEYNDYITSKNLSQ